jgi:hypothetical protein
LKSRMSWAGMGGGALASCGGNVGDGTDNGGKGGDGNAGRGNGGAT